MWEMGLFADRRVELIDGDLIEMNPQGPVHANLTGLLHDLLVQTYGPHHHVRDHSPVDISPHDQPEPDVALVRGARSRRMAHPQGHQLVLVIEVSSSTRDKDRKKAGVYARGGVPEYWLIDTERRRLEVYRQPDGDEYRVRHVLDEDDRVRWPERDDDVVVAELLP